MRMKEKMQTLRRINFNELDQRSDQSANPQLGRVLSQPLAARQSHSFDAWRQLHRWLLVEHLRQTRHRDLGDAGARLSSVAGWPAAIRTSRLPAWHLVLLVSL